MQAPLYIGIVSEDLLTSFQPERHLWEFVAVIGCTVGVFGKVNVQTFSVGCVGSSGPGSGVLAA